MHLTILNVAYPFAAVGVNAVGGAQQVVAQLDRALIQAGHDSVVMSAEGSEVQGIPVAMPGLAGTLDEMPRQSVYEHYRRAIGELMMRWRFDVIHMHGADFHEYLPPPGVPVLVTLHLPPRWYLPEVFKLSRPHTYFHCVSETQQRAYPASPSLSPVASNGVPEERVLTSHARRESTLACDTPVVGFNAGALAKIVEHRRMGFLASNHREMAEAIQAPDKINPEACRVAARDRFSEKRTMENYFSLYRKLAAEMVQIEAAAASGQFSFAS